MRISKKVDSPTKLTLTITADVDDLKPVHAHTLRHFTKSVKVPGFRAGHAPAAMVEKHVNQQVFLDEFMEHALNDLYGKTIDAEKLRTAGPPNVNLKKFVPYTELEFEAEVEIIGEVKIANYKALKRQIPKTVVTAKDIEDVLKTLQDRSAERREVKVAVRPGDEVIIDFAGHDAGGKPVVNANGKDYPLVIGSSSFIPGFEENLVGMKTGDKKEFSLSFPADYAVADMQGQKISFKTTVKKVSELVSQNIDDKFAATVGPFATLSDLKDDIKKQLLAERQQQAERDFQNQLIADLANKSNIDVPDGLVDSQVLSMEEDEKKNLAFKGVTWQEHLKDEGITDKEHRDRHRDQAFQRVKGGLMLSEIAERENIEVSPAELDARIMLLKSQYGDSEMQAQLSSPEGRRDIAGRIMTEKTVATLVEYATNK